MRRCWTLLNKLSRRNGFNQMLPRHLSTSCSLNSLGDCEYPPAAPLLDADSYITWDVTKPVKLRMGDSFPHNRPPTTVQATFRAAADRYPNKLALAVRRDPNNRTKWTEFTYSDYLENIINTAKAFNAIGLERFCGVGILAFNSPEWLFSSVGAIFAGGLSSGIYSTSSAETVQYLGRHAPYHIFCVENVDELKRVIAGKTVKEAFPDVKKVVFIDPSVVVPDELRNIALSWSELQEIGRKESGREVQQLEDNQAANQACLLSYTSGTTGTPKGVIQSHDNLTWSPFSFRVNSGHVMGSERLLSYLPPSHSASLVVDCFHFTAIAGSVYFADKDALKGKLVENLRDVKPTILVAVPRVLEKIEERVQDAIKGSSKTKRWLFNWASRLAHERAEEIRTAGPKVGIGLTFDETTPPEVSKSLQYKIAEKLIFSRIHDQLGLTDVVKSQHGGIFAGAAPIRLSTHKFFEGLAIPIMEMYGATECQLCTVCKPGRLHLSGSVGTEVYGTKSKLLDVGEEGEEGVGEFAEYGRNVVMGYHKDEERTKEAFTEDNFFRTGDLATQNEDGFYFIYGRQKEIIVTSGGKNISPVPIEAAIKEQLPMVVSNAIVIGESRKYLTCLITLRVEPDLQTMQPTDILSPPVVQWCCKVLNVNKKQLGKMESVQDFLKHPRFPELRQALWTGIDAANARSENKASRVQKFTVLDKEVSVQGGELGPTLKLKRFFVHNKYKDVIDQMYKEGGKE